MTFVLRANDQARQRVLENACEFLRRLSPAKSWRVEVAEHRERRSDAQNRYLWGVAYAQLAKATGQPAEDWHEYFLGEHFARSAGRPASRKQSSRSTSSSSRRAPRSTASTFLIPMRAEK